MHVRRVVAGKNAEGKSVFVSDTRVAPITPVLTPGAEFHTIWGSDVVTQLPQDGTIPAFTQWFPPPGGYRIGLFSVAPANAPAPQVTDMAAAFADLEEKLPGLAGHMEPDAPGMHTTQTIDVELVTPARCGWSWMTAPKSALGRGIPWSRTGRAMPGGTNRTSRV